MLLFLIFLPSSSFNTIDYSGFFLIFRNQSLDSMTTCCWASSASFRGKIPLRAAEISVEVISAEMEINLMEITDELLFSLSI